jgi:hypothetical protein
VAVVVVFLLCRSYGDGDPGTNVITYQALANRLVNLESLAELPFPGEQCAQWSSYNRKSRYDEKRKRYLGWGENGDGRGFIRREGDKVVLAEMKGPGCIWRMWSAKPGQGKVAIYLDDLAEPVIDMPFTNYFNGEHAPFTRSALVHSVAKGRNNYTPVPYQKSCKIVAETNWGRYYHFVYSTFPSNTIVPTFKADLPEEASKALDAVNESLMNCGPAPALANSTIKKLQLVKGTNSATLKLEGPAAISAIRLKVNADEGWNPTNGLRALTIEMHWDGEVHSAVWAPLGDFFGTAPGENAYRSLPMGITKDGWFYSNWYMPFERSAEIVIGNGNEEPASVEAEFQVVPLSQPIEKLARFHAKWHRDEFLSNVPELDIDWPFLRTTGSGRFVGMMLHVWNPRGGWWGEGDEKFFVNGEKFPSTFGTGSEDYFGYAWCDPGLFEHAFHNQTRNDGENRGHVSVNRWHIADNVPFERSFDGVIEKYFPDHRPTLYASIAYWYLKAGASDPYHPLELQDRVGYWVQPEEPPVPGSSEAEKAKPQEP